jgi:hypothetical protein
MAPPCIVLCTMKWLSEAMSQYSLSRVWEPHCDALRSWEVSTVVVLIYWAPRTFLRMTFVVTKTSSYKIHTFWGVFHCCHLLSQETGIFGEVGQVICWLVGRGLREYEPEWIHSALSNTPFGRSAKGTLPHGKCIKFRQSSRMMHKMAALPVN